MKHNEAIDTNAAERYALGEMDEGERERYEEHFFGCAECAAEVKAAVLFVDCAKAILEQKDARPEDEPSERSAAAIPRRRSAGWKTLFWPMPLGAAASLAVVLGGPASYLGLVELPRLERARAEAEALQSAPGQFLSVSRSEPPVVSLAPAQRVAVLTLSRSLRRSSSYYLCEVRDNSGRVVLSNVVPAPSREDELRILLPTARLQPGAHVVAVAGIETPPARPTESEFVRYRFMLERQ
jgi:hypothetical protein